MKKLLFILGASFILCHNTHAQAFEKGKSFATIGYGLGFGFSSLSAAYASNSGYKTGAFGPIAVAYEYGVTDNIGIGGGINYSTFWAGWDEKTVVYNPLPTNKTYSYTWRLSALQVLGRANYHFPIKNDKLDLYGGVGLGFTKFGYSWESTNPDFNESSYNISLGSAVGYSLNLGGRYLFNDNVGAYAEIGYGLSIFNAGLAFRF